MVDIIGSLTAFENGVDDMPASFRHHSCHDYAGIWVSSTRDSSTEFSQISAKSKTLKCSPQAAKQITYSKYSLVKTHPLCGMPGVELSIDAHHDGSEF
jgi:hypothetical protein